MMGLQKSYPKLSSRVLSYLWVAKLNCLTAGQLWNSVASGSGRRKQKFIFGVFSLIVLFCVCSLVVSCGKATQSAHIYPNFSFQEKRVWVHVIQGPDYNQSEPGKTHGALYPLGLASSSNTNRSIFQINRFKTAGIDGLSVNMFEDQNVSNSLLDWLKVADGTGLVVAPCIDGIGHEDKVVQLVKDYAALASSHSSAARENGKLVIFIFVTGGLSPASWENVRQRIREAGIGTYFVANIDAGLSQYKDFPCRKISQYFPAFEAGYVFDDTYMKFWHEILTLFRSFNHTFAGGLEPGYDRETPNGGEVDALATELYRKGWQAQIDAKIQWTHVATWNDLVEHTEIRPTSDWNFTRSDLTAWYAAIFKGQPAPISSPQLYVTSPQQVHLNQTAPAEALVLNPTEKALTVQIQLFDGNARAVTNVISATVGAGKAAAATIPVKLTTMPSGRFLRAHATMLKGKTVVQTVISAPILVYNARFKTNLRRLYYSIPAQHAIPGKVGLSIPGNPLKGTVTATVTPPSGIAVRFAEVLQNTWEVKNMFNQPPYTTNVPLTNGNQIVGYQVITDDPSGFYMARVIDEQERVGYSDPIYKE